VVVKIIPSPTGDAAAPARAMIFDSVYDAYRGVVTYVRMIDGKLGPREKVMMMSTKSTHELLEIGVSSPEPTPSKGLSVGEVGYLITGVKDVRLSKVGDTVTTFLKPARVALKGYSEPKPMVFSGLYPIDGSDYPHLREALDKLKLSDAALVYEPETSVALGFGFRCGFLGLLHLEIIAERLEREFGLDLMPQPVVYEVTTDDRRPSLSRIPASFPAASFRSVSQWLKRSILAPKTTSAGAFRGVAELCSAWNAWALIVELHYTLRNSTSSISEKVTQGYASLDYEPSGNRLPIWLG
jgi:GTP-binding protein LepA